MKTLILVEKKYLESYLILIYLFYKYPVHGFSQAPPGWPKGLIFLREKTRSKPFFLIELAIFLLNW